MLRKLFKVFLITAILSLQTQQGQAALNAATQWTFFQDAVDTANMANGGGFNTANASFITDYTATGGTGNTSVLSSATYTFVAGDDEHWVFISAGANWNTNCFFQIGSVAAGAATLRTAIGEGPCLGATTSRYAPSTVAGVATVASPTSGTVGIDYTQSTTVLDAGTDLASADGAAIPCVVTSVSYTFTASEPGNIINISETGDGFTVARYEIVSVAAGAATLDRACGTAGAKTGGDYAVGGALSLGGAGTIDDAFFEQLVCGNRVWLKYNATAYTPGAVAMAADCTAAEIIKIMGYVTVRGDNPPLGSKPTINTAANILDFRGEYITHESYVVTGTGTNVMQVGTGNILWHMKVANTNGAGGNGLVILGNYTRVINSELSSTVNTPIYWGSTTNGGGLFGSYVHTGSICVLGNSAEDYVVVAHNIIAGCTTAGIQTAGGADQWQIITNTIAGSAVPAGTGFLLNATTGVNVLFWGNIVWGFTTPINSAALVPSNYYNCNNYYNNTNAPTNAPYGPDDTFVDPQFTDVAGGNFTVGGDLTSSNCMGLFSGSATTGYFNKGAVQKNAAAAAGQHAFGVQN